MPPAALGSELTPADRSDETSEESQVGSCIVRRLWGIVFVSLCHCRS